MVFIHNAKVLWVSGTHRQSIPDMYDKPYPLCRQYVRDHMLDNCFKGGKLVVVSMLDKEYKGF